MCARPRSVRCFAKGPVKTNYHQHTTWCDGHDDAETMICAAIDRGFDEIGFSSHARLPDVVEGNLTPDSAPAYAAEIRALAAKYADRLSVCLGVEADYIPGDTSPEKVRYAHLGLDYLIGSIHWVIAPDGAHVPVDWSPERLVEGVKAHFGGDYKTYVRTYFAQEREMVARFDFDVLGHPDLVRKFNGRLAYFDETADWYQDELRLTAEAIAASGKIVEINTGAIARGWMDDVYPSAAFRALLRARGVRFLLGSDAHAAAGIDCAFERYGEEAGRLDKLPLPNLVSI